MLKCQHAEMPIDMSRHDIMSIKTRFAYKFQNGMSKWMKTDIPLLLSKSDIVELLSGLRSGRFFKDFFAVAVLLSNI